MSKKNDGGHDRVFIALIAILCCVAAALVVLIAVQSAFSGRSATTTTASSTVSSATDSATSEALVLVADDYSLDDTPEPTATPSVTLMPTATEEPYEYLPVYTKGDTTEKKIAITIDDISNISALKTAVTAAEELGAKLTLFPYGSTILDSDVTEVLKTCVLELGYEVENRTQNNVALYSLDTDDFALEILTPDVSLDYALSKDYSMHLLRPLGGVGTNDPRTHDYFMKLGYDGIVTWTYYGTTATVTELKETLAPGNIYAFDGTTDSIKYMVAFMEYCDSLGYEMVTVNEILGFEENSCEDPEDDILTRDYAMPDDYELYAFEFSTGDRAYQVKLIQERLIELGYLSSDSTADGIYGSGTASAIMAFQAQLGQPCTGIGTVTVQRLLFADEAPSADSAATSDQDDVLDAVLGDAAEETSEEDESS